MAKFAAFSVPDAHRIVRAVHAVEGGPRTTVRIQDRVPNNGGQRYRAYVVKIETAIPAASGDTPGQATLPLYKFDDDDQNLVAIVDRDDEPVESVVYNLSEEESVTGYAIAVEEIGTGNLVLMSPGGAGGADGAEGCDCGNCLSGVTLPDATQCCQSHLAWELTNPWLDCEESELFLEFIGGDIWLTDPFMGPDGSEYRWQMTVSIGAKSLLELVVEEANGNTPVAIEYGRDSFDCLCDNVFTIKRPYGRWSRVEREQLSCEACIKPMPLQVGYCDIGLSMAVTFEKTFNGPTSVAGLAGTHVLTYSDGLWRSSNDRMVATCQGAYCGSSGEATPPGSVAVYVTMCGDCQNDDAGDNDCYFDSVECDEGDTQLSTYWGTMEVGGTDLTIRCQQGFIEPSWRWYTATVEPPEATKPEYTGVCEEDEFEPPPAPEDPDAGACCLDGTCFDFLDEGQCGDFGGTWDATGCGTCEDIIACCIGGNCLPIPAGRCTAFGGDIVEGSCDDAESPCDSGAAPPTEGACCRRSTGASCSNDSQCECYDGETEAECGEFGTWYGGETCAEFVPAYSCTCDNGPGICEQG